VARTLLVTVAVAAGVWLAAVAGLVAFGRRSAARELVALLPNLIALFRGLLRDPRVSRGSKVWLGIAVLWFVSPIDLVPEFVPVLGPLDDAVVAMLVLRHVLKRTDRDVLAEHWRGAPATLDVILRTAR
jgi:uncharacterized membrane protein YkvA (DUF1232 family)